METLGYVLLLLARTVWGFGGPLRSDSLACASQCILFSSPCTCYNDGWIDCKATLIERVPAELPKCARLLSFGQNRITEIGECFCCVKGNCVGGWRFVKVKSRVCRRARVSGNEQRGGSEAKSKSTDQGGRRDLCGHEQ